MVIRPQKNYSKIYSEPVNEIVNKINCSERNTFLVGDVSTGKSLILEHYLNQPKGFGEIVIDGTPKMHEYLSDVLDFEIQCLIQTCLLLQKILEYIKTYQFQTYLNHFLLFENKIIDLLKKLKAIYMFGNYNQKQIKIDDELLKNPDILFEEFMSYATSYLDYNTITVVIDGFDAIGESSKFYQRLMYNMLSKHVRLIATVSDRTVVNKKSIQDELSHYNDLIMVDYSKDVETVKKIIDLRLKNNFMQFSQNKIHYFNFPLAFFLSDETIQAMIDKTNGNIFDMSRAVSRLIQHLDELTPKEYDTFLLNYIDKEINKSPILSGIIIPKRVLHIKNEIIRK